MEGLRVKREWALSFLHSSADSDRSNKFFCSISLFPTREGDDVGVWRWDGWILGISNMCYPFFVFFFCSFFSPGGYCVRRERGGFGPSVAVCWVSIACLGLVG